MISGHDILYLSSIDWTFLWQGPQEIAVRLGAAGNRVLYVENTGVRAPRLSDARRVARRIATWAQSARAGGERTVAPNVHLCSPLILPPFGPPWQRSLNRRLLARELRGALHGLGFQPSVIWTYLPTDTAQDLAAQLDAPQTAVVYYCVTDFRHFAPQADRLAGSERAIATRSDVVFASCDELAARFAPWNANVHIFPFGVDLALFTPDESAPAPPRLSSLPRPIIGYVGALERAVDLDLLVTLARGRPQWSWVYIGAVMRDLGPLASLPNVHLLGQQPHQQLPRHIAQFDVAIVPYARSRSNETVVPTKINEYLAMGKPVVSTDLPAVRAFNARHQVLTTVPPESHSFLAAIDAALSAARDPAAIQRRRQVAAAADWGTRLEQMSALVETQLNARAARARVD